MPRRLWRQCPETGVLIEVDLESSSSDRSPSAPVVHQDTIDPLWHPVDGKVYDSKSSYRAVTRAAGYEEYSSADIKPEPYEPPPGQEEAIRGAKECLERYSHVSDPVERMNRAINDMRGR